MVQQLAARCFVAVVTVRARRHRHRNRQVDGFQHKLAAAFGRAGLHLHGALGDAAGAGTLKAQRFEFAKAALIALAAGGYALARPSGLGRDLAVHLVQDNGLVGENALRPVVELAEIPLTAAQLAVVQPDDAGAQIAQESAVVADHEKGAAMLAQHVFHPFDGRHVHMVGRLVEKQDIGFGIERAGQRHAARLATGQAVAHPVGVEA